MKNSCLRYLVPALMLFSACGASETSLDTGSGALTPPGDVASLIPSELSRLALGSAQYTIIDPTVRGALTNAGQDFRIPVRAGAYTFPASVLVGRYGTISVDTDNIAYGDLTGDGVLDAVVRVKAGTDEFSTVELAAFTASGGTAHQFAAFPLGQASIRSVVITAGKIRVNFTHIVPGDPGPRSTQLTLELPKK